MLSHIVVLLALSSCCAQQRIPVFIDVSDWCEFCREFQTKLWKEGFQQGFGDMVAFNVNYGDSDNDDLVYWTACAQNILAPAIASSDYTWFGVTECVDASGNQKTTTQCIKEVGMDKADAAKVQKCMNSTDADQYVKDMEAKFKKTAGASIPQSFVNGQREGDWDFTVSDVCDAWTGSKKPECCGSNKRKCLLEPANDQSIINEVNRNGQWTAGVNDVFQGKTEGSIRRLMGVVPSSKPSVTVDPTPLVGAPHSFDPRTQWPKCTSMSQIRNQAECGSCWAFGAVEAFTDRYCVAMNQTENPIFSAENMVSCDGWDSGCHGGNLYTAWKYLLDDGVPTEHCQPYTIPTCPPEQQPCMNFKPTPKCSKKCYGTTNQTVSKKYYISSIVETHSMVSDIQDALMKNGPVEVAFDVFADFLHYKSGVYSHTTGKYLGGHAVKMLGWGSENGTDFWLVANSWTTSWGDAGYFKIKRGTNECDIEAGAVAGIPKV